MKYGIGHMILGEEDKKKLNRRLKCNNRKESIDRLLTRVSKGNVQLCHTLFMKMLPDAEHTQTLLRQKVCNGSPFALIRWGLYEYKLCYQYIEKTCGIRQDYSAFIRQHICMDAGFFPDESSQLDGYAKKVISLLKEADIVAYWTNIPNKNIFSSFFRNDVYHIDVNQLYPYPFWHKSTLPNWQEELTEKKVLIVSSFADTIMKQYRHNHNIWENQSILPDFQLLVYKAVQTCGGGKDTRFKNWNEALQYMLEEICKIEFDIALVSCGSYGMPLALELKKRGKKVIQWGGCFQLWFGIKGARWDNDPLILPYVNEAWCYPSKMETPSAAAQVNNASYWERKGGEKTNE